MNVAVLTGDLVESTQLDEQLREQIEEQVQLILENYHDETLFKESANYFFYRGDSLQIVLKNQSISLYVALLLRLAVKKISTSDIRFAIGIGQIEVNTGAINQSTGSAFLYSGKSLDEIGDERLVFKSSSEYLNDQMNISFRLLETIIARWSLEMSEAVFYQLMGLTQKETAQKLNRSPVAISKRLQSAHYEEVKLFLDYYENLIRSL